MRQIGSLSNENQAHLFADFLVTQGIVAHAEEEEGKWVIWVRDEDHLQDATERLEHYTENPADQRYHGVRGQAEEIRRDQEKRRQQARRNLIEMRGRWRGPAARRPGGTERTGSTTVSSMQRRLSPEPKSTSEQRSASSFTLRAGHYCDL